MGVIYLDYAATTPLSDNVKKNIVESISSDEFFYNSGSSTYEQAEVVKQKIELARATISETLNVLPREIVFTSGATESNNLAIKGAAFANRAKGNHIITSKAEHKAVLDVCKYLESEGFEVTYLNVNKHGKVSAEDVKAAITSQTILVSIMAVNNELGTVNDLTAIGNIAHQNKILFHVDAAQGYGKIDIDVDKMHIDMLSMSGHKIYAPKGVGFLYVRSKKPRVKVAKQMHGGTQEHNLRAGTLANHQIFALAEACSDISNSRIKNFEYILRLRNYFLQKLSVLDNIFINTDLDNSYPGIINVTFSSVKAETLLAMLDGICLSVGSACNSKAIEPSHVLSAIGLSADDADSTVRVSFGLYTTIEDLEYVATQLVAKIQLLRAISPVRLCDV